MEQSSRDQPWYSIPYWSSLVENISSLLWSKIKQPQNHCSDFLRAFAVNQIVQTLVSAQNFQWSVLMYGNVIVYVSVKSDDEVEQDIGNDNACWRQYSILPIKKIFSILSGWSFSNALVSSLVDFQSSAGSTPSQLVQATVILLLD